MNKNWIRVLCFTLLLFSATAANAVVIVDTGPGPGGDTGGWTLGDTQWLAGEFTTTEDYIITSIEGWINPLNSTGIVRVALYSDGGEIPGTQLFSDTFSKPGTSGNGWYGVSGLSWELLAGTYWVSFEGVTGTGGAMPYPSATPLANEAFFNSINSAWNEKDDLDIGVKILGDVSAVPEPTALALLGLGLVGGLGYRRKK